MKQFLVASLLLAGAFSCNNNQAGEHAHNPDGSHPKAEALHPLSYTLYSNRSELFVEFKPLVVGQTSKFAGITIPLWGTGIESDLQKQTCSMQYRMKSDTG